MLELKKARHFILWMALLSVLFVLFVACQAINNPPTAYPPSTPIVTLMVTKPQPTATSHSRSLLDPTLVPNQRKLENQLVQSCLQNIDVASHAYPEYPLLALYDRNAQEVYLYDSKADKISVLSDAHQLLTYISPNRKWVAYESKTEKTKLLVQSFDGKETYTATIEDNATLAGWVNDENVILSLYGHQPEFIHILNPFTEEQTNLNPSFPGIYDIGAWDWNYSGRTIYSPNLRFVIYPTIFVDAPAGDVLWNIQKKQKVANILITEMIAVPQWAPNGQLFAVKVMARNGDELYSLNVDGMVTVLTNFRKLFPSATTYIRTWSWSPDSQKIALWLDFYNKDAFEDERLMVLDLQSGVISDYCISGDSIQIKTGSPDFTPAPIWSPNSKFLLIEQRTSLSESVLTLIDTDEKITYTIGQNVYPIGWMTRKP